MMRRWSAVVLVVVPMLLIGCPTSSAVPPDSLLARAEHPVVAPHGVSRLVAERAGSQVPAVWSAASGVLVADVDGSTVWIAPAVPGAYVMTARFESESADVEVVVASAVEVVEAFVGSEGGEVLLSGGERVTFEAGALTTTSAVRVATFEVAPADYGPDVSRIAPATQFTVDGTAINMAGSGVSLFLPAVGALADSSATLVEIRVALRDGSTHVQLDSYSPLSSETSVVTIPAELLFALDEEYGLPDSLSIVLQPLDIGGVTVLLPSAVDYVTGLFKVDLEAASMAGAAAVCDTGAQRMPSWVTTAVGPPARQPVVLVHGWQVLANFGASLFNDLRAIALSTNPLSYILLRDAGTPQRNPAFCGWAPLINHLADIGIGEHAELYVFGYDSERHVGENATLLRTAIESTFDGQAPIIVAHSMGGMVSDAAHFQGLRPKSVLTLGTPYRGSLALSCGLSNPFSHRCLVGKVHPRIALMTLYPLQILGLRMVLVRALSSFQGTRDLTWDDSFYSSNAFLKHIHKAPARDLSTFTAFYGDLRSDDSGADALNGLMQSVFFGPLGYASDGIVSVNSGTLDLGDAQGAWVGAIRGFAGADHNVVKGGSDLTSPPSCGVAQEDPSREKACEVMRAVGDFLLGQVAPPAPGTFTDWQSVDTTANRAEGVIGSVAVTFTGTYIRHGVTDGSFTGFDRDYFTPPLASTDYAEFGGHQSTYSYALAFSSPVTNPIIHLVSLASTVTFAEGTVVRVSGQPGFTVSGNSVTGLYTDVGVPNDSNGTVQLLGTFSTISFTATYSRTNVDGIGLQVGVP